MKILFCLTFIFVSSAIWADEACVEQELDSRESGMNTYPTSNQESLSSCGAYTFAQMADFWEGSQSSTAAETVSANETSGLLMTLMGHQMFRQQRTSNPSVRGMNIRQMDSYVRTAGSRNWSCPRSVVDDYIIRAAAAEGVTIRNVSYFKDLLNHVEGLSRKLYSEFSTSIQDSNLLSSYRSLRSQASLDSNSEEARFLARGRELMCQLHLQHGQLESGSYGIDWDSFRFIEHLVYSNSWSNLILGIQRECDEEAARRPLFSGDGIPRLHSFDRQNENNSRSAHLDAFNSAFSGPNPQPLAVSYCHRILKSSVFMNHRSSSLTGPDSLRTEVVQTDCGGHWGLVSGQKRDPRSGQCLVKIRSTHGANCSAYMIQFPCDRGHVWVPRDLLLDNMDEAYYYGP